MELLFLVFGVAGLWIGTELTIGGAMFKLVLAVFLFHSV